jgi:Zn-dependent protease with chaperone function
MTKFRDRFTRAFARFYHGPIEAVESFNGYTSDEEVYWFESDSAAFGQATPIGTIILNKKRMENLSHEAAELVYRHERGHLDRLPVFRGLFYGMVFNGVLGIYYLLKSLGYSLLIPFGMPATPVGLLAGVSLLMILAFVVTVRLEELAADLHALQTLGEEEFLDAYDEISAEGSDTLHNQIITALLYPRLNNVIRVQRFLNWMKSLSSAENSHFPR